MDAVFELVRKLVLLVIFAGFIELLLPRSSYRNYTRMVVGLLVIAMILQPLAELKGATFDLEGLLGIANWNISRSELQGSEWQQVQTQELVERQLEDQVREFLVKDYPGHVVSVELDVGFDEYGNLSIFRGMEVVLRPSFQGIEPVQPVSIGGAKTIINKSPCQPEIVNSMAHYLGLPASKITVWVYTGGGDADGQ